MAAVRRTLLLNAFKLFDLGLMAAAFAVASLAVFRETASAPSFAEFLQMRVSMLNVILFSALLGTWHISLRAFGMYTSRRMSDRLSEVRDALLAVLAFLVVLAAVGALLRLRVVDPLFLFVFGLALAVMVVSSRMLLRMFLSWVRRHGRNLRHLLIAGTNARSLEFARKVAEQQDLGYRLEGFIDIPWSGISQVETAGYKVVCDFNGLRDYLRQNVVDEIVIGLPLRSLHGEASAIAAACEEQGITFRFLSNIFNTKLSKSSTDELEGDHFISHHTGNIRGWQAGVKRAIDVVVSSLMLVLLSPVFILTAIAIKFSSPGPVFFGQTRVGLNKRRFKMHKFRSMYPDAEARLKELEHLNVTGGPTMKIPNDPRITPIGRWIRKLSIDELPQLVNVLMGDMSLVGPRPLPVRDYEGFNEDWQRRRFSVRPGITCIWQVAGRSSITFDRWMQLDLEYIDKWSLMLDIEILLKTIPAVLRGTGAA